MTREPGYAKLEKKIKGLEKTVQEYQQKELKLREDRSFRSAIVKHAAEGICVCHEISEYPYVRFTVWNDQMRELTGYTMEEINCLGWYQSVYPDPEVQERAIKRMGQMRVGDDLIREEWIITRKDREKRTFHISTSILETDDGKKHALGMMKDVTESKKEEDILKKSRAELEQQVSKGKAELIKTNEALRGEIKKHQLAESALKRSEEKFAKAFHSSPNAIVISRIDDGFIFEANEGFARFTGYSHEETIGRLAIELNIWADPDDRERYVSIMKKKGCTEDREFRFCHKSGKLQIGLLSGESIKIGDDLCLLSNIVDITEQKRIETALLENKRLLEESQALAHLGSWEWNILTNANIWSDEMYRIFGRKPDSFVPNYDAFSAAMHPADRDRVLEAVQRSVESDLPFLENYRIVRPDGSERTIQSTAKVHRDEDRPVRMVGSVLDITERKQVEEALRQSEQRFKEMADNIREVFWLFDYKNQKVIYVSPAYEEIWGRSIQSLYDNYEDWSQSIHPEDMAHAEKSFEAILKTGGGEPREYRIIRPDGTVRWMSDRGFAIKDNDGNTVRIAGIAEDITPRKEAEKERRELESHLQKTLRLEAIGTLAGGIAHQFNNALTGITGNLDLLELDLPDKKSIRRYIEQMRNSSSQMVNLTNQLLGYARGGKYQAKIVPFNDFVRDALSLSAYKIKPSVFIETDLPNDILSVKADLTQMQMVLSAILINASEAIEDTGLIRITCRNEKITDDMGEKFREIKPGQYVRLTIEDDGCGMDEETRERIFDPFFTTKVQGRGLGLAAAFGVLKNHDGLISVESELGKGTIVSIFLPGIKHLKMEKEEPAQELIKGAGTILLIEDEERVMDVGRRLLEKLGYRVLEAKTGQEASYIAKTFDGDIDIAFLDIFLPDMGGREIYPRLKENRPKMKVIVCSGYSIAGPAQEILDAGAHSFIQKPFDLKMLSEKLSEVLEKN